MLAIYLLLVAGRLRGKMVSFPAHASAGVLAIASLVTVYALTRSPDQRAVAPLLPALRSPWLQIHVLSTLVGYAAFGVAAGLGLTLLIRRVVTKETRNGDQQARTMERSVALGFPWLTLGILTGAIWAQNAWGRYWGWDPKETWALITWLWYLLVLHLRPLPGWRGRRLAGLVVVGFGMVLFTFVGVPWLVRLVRLESLHGF
jgi:ABC-type transport system involved in cytochrome c biogenesis permease subunit